MMGVSSPKEVHLYWNLGVRIFFVGVDVSMKRRMLTESLAPIKATVEELSA